MGKRSPTLRNDPLEETINSLIHLKREIPLNANTLTKLIQSLEFNKIDTSIRKKFCEEIAIIYGDTVMKTYLFRTKTTPDIPTLFELIKINTLNSDDYVVSLTAITDLNLWRKRIEDKQDSNPQIVPGVIVEDKA